MAVGFSDSGPTMYLVQGRAKRVLHGSHCTDSNLIHIQGWMNVRESYSRALKHGTLGRHHSNSDLIHSHLISCIQKNLIVTHGVGGGRVFANSLGWMISESHSSPFQKDHKITFQTSKELYYVYFAWQYLSI